MKRPLHRLSVPDHLAKLIRGMHPDLKRKINAGLSTILNDPLCGKVLRDELEGMRSFRVSTFRIIYRIPNRRFIEIVAIGPRKSIYQETYRLISK